MLQFFRNMFKSSLGVGIAIVFLVLIVGGFAASDVAGNLVSDATGGGDRIAKVGSTSISSNAVVRQAQQAVEIARQDNPKVTMRDFLAQNGLSQVIDQMIDRTAITTFGEKNGIVAGKRLVDSELAKIPSLQGPDGHFSDVNYRTMLAQRNLTDKDVRNDIEQGLIARQILTPAQLGMATPNDMALRYATLLKDKRIGSVAALPSQAFAPAAMPGDAEVASWYATHATLFNQPERRVIRYAIFDDTAAKNVAAPTDAEIAQRYNADKAQYEASELRKISQLILPSEAVAKAMADELAKGGSLEAAAKARGLSVSAIGPVTKVALAAQASSAVADAAFAAKKGQYTAPIKSLLGYALVHVDDVVLKPARSLDQVKGEIAAALMADKRKAALASVTSKIEDSFDKGGALSDAAKEMGVTPVETAPLLADGTVFGKPGEKAPADLTKAVTAAFAMERTNAPQLAELEAGKKFLMFDVTQIVPAAPLPLAQVKPAVIQAIQMEKGAIAAKAAALKVLDKVKHGSDLNAAVAALGAKLPPIQPVSMTREQLQQAPGGQIPPAMGLFFSMAKGTTKLLPVPGGRGWLVVQLKDIQTQPVDAKDPLVADARREIAGLLGREYTDALRSALRADVGATRNDAAIAAVAKQLAGGN
ncbi:MAG: SurA N-terminal domain-containing protein [Sphingomonadales bacterium]|nr:SurA N-terminal domain-containing protein [Sphingomonadales bacterium]MDE2169978.1 SurA N-terminal domain-containing protein [Sphingomonadales bacterium]